MAIVYRFEVLTQTKLLYQCNGTTLIKMNSLFFFIFRQNCILHSCYNKYEMNHSVYIYILKSTLTSVDDLCLYFTNNMK